MGTKIYTTYAPSEDITFILEDSWNGTGVITTEVKGLYFGEPNEEATKEFYGKLSLDFDGRDI